MFLKYRRLITENINTIGLPLDFPDRNYRNKENNRNVRKILSYLKKFKKHPQIRIGTVVTKDNWHQLSEIGELISNYPIYAWKLYEFTPQEVNALKNRKLFEISGKKFESATARVFNRFSRKFTVIISKRKHRNRAYFFIDPDGTVFVPVDGSRICRQVKVGNIFDKDIFNKWQKLVLQSNYLKNA